MHRNGNSTGVVTHDCYISCIAIESANIFTDPTKSLNLISDTVISWNIDVIR